MQRVLDVVKSSQALIGNVEKERVEHMIIKIDPSGNQKVLQEERMAEIRELWEECFGDSQSYMDFYFDWKCGDNLIYVWEEEGKIVSMVQLNPYKLSILDKEIQSYYIVGVATRATYRKRGLMRKLLNASMAQLKKEKVPFVYLMPASQAIYLPFDYRVISQQELFTMPVAQLNQISDNQEGISSLENSSVDYEDLAQFANNKLQNQYEIDTKRSQYYYERMLAEMQTAEGGILVLCDDDTQGGKVQGYAAYMIEEGQVQVMELLCEEDQKEEFMQELKATPKEQVPTIMARIIDWEAMLSLMTASSPVTITVEVIDPILQGNTGSYQLKFSKDGCQVVKFNSSEGRDVTQGQVDVSAEIALFTQFFFGQLSAEEFLSQSLPQGKGQELNANQELLQKLKAINQYQKIFINEIV